MLRETNHFHVLVTRLERNHHQDSSKGSDRPRTLTVSKNQVQKGQNRETKRTRVSLQRRQQRWHVAHGLVDPIAVLQGGAVAVELLGQPVQVGEAAQQVVLARLSELRVAHEALHQVQPGRGRGRTDTHTHTAALISWAQPCAPGTRHHDSK